MTATTDPVMAAAPLDGMLTSDGCHAGERQQGQAERAETAAAQGGRGIQGEGQASERDPHAPGIEGVRFGDFVEAPGGLMRVISKKDGLEYQPLTNFHAKIVGETTFDDGAERWAHFEIEAQVQRPRGPVRRFTVPAEEFATLDWVDQHLGALAVIAPAASNKLIIAAIKERSIAGRTVRQREVYAHLGWRRIAGRWAYLHAGGIIDTEGAGGGVEVQPPARLKRYALELPTDRAEAATALAQSLGLLTIGKPEVMVPLWLTIWRALFGRIESVLWIAGRTGTFKSEVAALAQQHFGREMDARHLPEGWASTANAIEATLFSAKDAVVVVDDYAPGTTKGSKQELEAKADRVLRGAGNGAGRGRLTADAKQRPDRPPLAQAIVTGEDTPPQHSIKARAIIVTLETGDIDKAKLSEAQRRAREGVYAKALAGFVRWLAQDYLGRVQEWRARAAAYRDQFYREGVHGRSPVAMGQLLATADLVLAYAEEIGVEIPPAVLAHLGEEGDFGEGTVARRMGRILADLVAEQIGQQQQADPARLFVSTLGEALAAGRAYAVDVHTLEAPAVNAASLGWRKETVIQGGITSDPWRHAGEHIGWVDLASSHLLLNPPVAYAVVNRLLGEQGTELTKKPRTLWGELHAAGWVKLVTVEAGRIRKHTHKRKIDGHAREVLAFGLADVLAGAPSTPLDLPEG